jgi:hypothetical protein
MTTFNKTLITGLFGLTFLLTLFGCEQPIVPSGPKMYKVYVTTAHFYLVYSGGSSIQIDQPWKAPIEPDLVNTFTVEEGTCLASIEGLMTGTTPEADLGVSDGHPFVYVVRSRNQWGYFDDGGFQDLIVAPAILLRLASSSGVFVNTDILISVSTYYY